MVYIEHQLYIMKYMRFYDLILGMKDWDLKDELENKEVISINRVLICRESHIALDSGGL